MSAVDPDFRPNPHCCYYTTVYGDPSFRLCRPWMERLADPLDVAVHCTHSVVAELEGGQPVCAAHRDLAETTRGGPSLVEACVTRLRDERLRGRYVTGSGPQGGRSG